MFTSSRDYALSDGRINNSVKYNYSGSFWLWFFIIFVKSGDTRCKKQCRSETLQLGLEKNTSGTDID